MKRRLLLFKSISLIVVALVMLVGITFAWFTPNTYIARIEVFTTNKKFYFEYFYYNQSFEEHETGIITRDLRDPKSYTKITDSETNENVPAKIVNMMMIPGSKEYFMIDMLMTEASNAVLIIEFIKFVRESTSQIYEDYMEHLKDKIIVHNHVQEYNTDGTLYREQTLTPDKVMLNEIVYRNDEDGEIFRLFNYNMSDGMRVRLFYEIKLSGEAEKTELTKLFSFMNVRFSVS